MGAVCSCTRAPPRELHGKTVSMDMYLDRRPYQYQHHAYNNGHVPKRIYSNPPVREPTMTSSHNTEYYNSNVTQGTEESNLLPPPVMYYSGGKPVGVVAARPNLAPPESPPLNLPAEKCESLPGTLDRTLASKFSASDSNVTNSLTDSPVSTLLGRRKPPPKPPRMNKPGLQHSKSLSTGSRTSKAARDTASPAKQSLRSALSEVTSQLDASITGLSLDDVTVDSEVDISVTQRKVHRVFAKTKEVVIHEVAPAPVAAHMFESGGLSPRMRDEVARTSDPDEAGQLLIDVVLSKGREDFLLFVDAIKEAGGKPHLAELLLALDGLLEALSGNDTRCPLCSSNNNLTPSMGDLTEDGPSFDIDVNYCDMSTGVCVSVKDYLAEQRANSDIFDSSLCSFDEVSNISLSLQRERRFLPMLSVSVYNQCLCIGNRAVELVDVIANRHCVRELSIVKCHLDADGMERLGFALQKNKTLARLDIRLNTIDDNGADSLASGLKRNHSLRSLNITGTGLSGDGCGLLATGLYKNHALTELDIGFNDLQDSGCREVSDVLSRDTALRKLRMRDNNISANGCQRVFASLKHNHRLTMLDLSSNRVDECSMATLGEVLLVNRSLRELNLENCKICSSACTSLARALKTNSVLHGLDLGMNPIGDAGVTDLADGLRYNHGLDMLSLNMCQISNQGFLSLLEALKYNSSLNTLKLCYNNIGSGATKRQTVASSGADAEGGADPNENVPGTYGDVAPQANHAAAMVNGTDGALSNDVTLDFLYDKLCRVLQLNKDLRVLLWGNRFCDPTSRESMVTDT